MFKPIKLEKPEQAFGVHGAVLKELTPSDIPEEFYEDRNPWVKIIHQWFFEGLPKGTNFVPKTGIDAETAYHHISAVLRSWEPKHEDKTAACAYMLSLWMQRVDIPKREKKPRDYSMDAGAGSMATSGKGTKDDGSNTKH